MHIVVPYVQSQNKIHASTYLTYGIYVTQIGVWSKGTVHLARRRQHASNALYHISSSPLFDAAYLRNGTNEIHSYNETLIGTYTLTHSSLKDVISNDVLEWLSEISKHRAVSVRHLRFLLHFGMECNYVGNVRQYTTKVTIILYCLCLLHDSVAQSVSDN